MTLFDLIAIGILLVSALVGFTRGAVRELITVFAFMLSALAALYLLPVVRPFLIGRLGPPWAANAAAVVLVFVVAYILLRVAAHWMTARLHEQPALGALNRGLGLAFGVVRALVFFGVFYLVFNMATPPELVPSWIADAKLYPVARISGRIVGAVAPKALRVSSHIGPALTRAVTDPGEENQTTEAEPDEPVAPSAAQSRSKHRPPRGHGYDKRTRDGIDALVERSR